MHLKAVLQTSLSSPERDVAGTVQRKKASLTDAGINEGTDSILRKAHDAARSFLL